MPETNLDKLKAVLNELFMLDQADLDFGIYRVMNAKRAEVTRFLDNDLLPQVRAALAHHSGLVSLAKQAELDQTIENARRLGVHPDAVPKVLELRDAIQRDADPADLENEVFSDLANFFRRYYQGGDFLALRRYKAGVYAIPYEGEEVKLHWANADQYYIKTSEYLRDYTFKLPDGRRVHFKLVEADTESDNKKVAAGQERRFILCATEPLLESNGELVIRFEYRPDLDKRKQADLNAIAAQQIFASPGTGSVSPSPAIAGEGRGAGDPIRNPQSTFRNWLATLAAKVPTEKNPNRTLLEKHLADYTSRNTFDYFIHKDIGGFLRRELDFFIKNEIMHLDDVEEEQAPRVEQYLAKIKAIRAIARKIIAFLDQLENFQKKLWLKKKFVVETNYCATLDRVSESLYPAIVANDAQRAEWVRIFAIDEIQADLVKPGYSVPLTVEFLNANQFLVLDTKFFPLEFRDKLLASNEVLAGEQTLDAATNGLLVRTESFQGLSLLQQRFAEAIDCGFIDPPYNTGNDGFPYKDTYQHSSWYSMLSDRIGLLQKLLTPDALFACNIDDHELYRLGFMLNAHLGEDNRAACAPWKSEASGGKEKTGLRTGHEYLLVYHNGDSKSISQAERSTGELDREDKFGRYRKGRELRKWGGTSMREDRRGQWYPLTTPSGEKVWPIRNDGKEGHWRWGPENPGIVAALKDPDVFHWELTPYDPGVLVDEKAERWVPYQKIRDEKKSVGWTTWLDNHGTNADATRTLKDLFGFKPFDTPKPVSLYVWLLGLHANENALAIDCFAGSGAVGQAVIEANREEADGRNRKYILLEMADYFDTVLKPRIQKVIYSKDWKDGKPVSRDGSSHLFKYLRLESYEDALNNLELKRTPDQDDLLRQQDQLREDYLLRYQLDVETRDSASLLNLAQFTNPFAYQLKVATGSVGESRPVNVDLIETFNYLLGLRVAQMDTIRGFRVVQGLNPAGEKVLVIWRNVAEKSNADLDAFFQTQDYSTKDMEFALIYVNGDNNLENLKRPDETWKVRRTEDEFKRLMFDVADV